MTENSIIQIVAGLIGSIGFAVLFNIHGKKLVAAGVGGGFAWLLFAVLNIYIVNEAICYFLVSFVISIYAEICARVLKTPTTAFLTISLIPLIPGATLYYTMVYAFDANGEMFIQKAFSTLQLAAALALGIIVTTAIVRILNKTVFIKHHS